MTEREALKLALEGLEEWRFGGDPRAADKYITAIKEALAQPEQEPVAIVESSWNDDEGFMREDIIKLAREAGVYSGANEMVFAASLERFAALIAAAEREQFAVHAVDIARRAVAEERKACAEICDRFQARDVGMQPAECAGAIRARGQR